MSAILYPGTFDPPHLGHLHIIDRLAALFARVEVAIGQDSEKNDPFFSLQERKALLTPLVSHHKHVRVSTFERLLIDHAKELACNCLARSLCDLRDYAREKELAFANKTMSGIETVFLLADPPFQSIRASILRDIAANGGSLTPFVSPSVAAAVQQKLF